MGRSGQVAERGRTASNSTEARFDAGPRSGSKRSVGYGLRIYPHSSFVSSKRRRGDGTYWGAHENKVNEMGLTPNDLRLKLVRRRSKRIQYTRLEERRKIGHMNQNIDNYALPSPSNGRFQPRPEARDIFHPRQISYAKNADRIHLGDPMQKLDTSRILDEAGAQSPVKSFARNGVFYASVPTTAFKGNFENAKPVRPLALMSGIGEEISQGGVPLTVSRLLHSLGLEKYEIAFRAEEVDMAALKQMGEKDLKDLGIPMGPRKKILQSLLPPSKQQPSRVRNLK
ncbi:hypothetical protein QN277_013839 [Acacia crassicarpa]|uniref:SAM domain-containing protein n=1 Tax=Acacia crassicarpa TaxID=499986 RepID=A0AAE1N3A3_9FABA|nr:hypothetical protein QN277_013839 [Acacia crassicarpa]